MRCFRPRIGFFDVAVFASVVALIAGFGARPIVAQSATGGALANAAPEPATHTVQLLGVAPPKLASGPIFLFTGLNEVKPAMIGEATSRAREAARKFAEDSGSTLGGIRHADQGVFEILPRDQARTQTATSCT